MDRQIHMKDLKNHFKNDWRYKKGFHHGLVALQGFIENESIELENVSKVIDVFEYLASEKEGSLDTRLIWREVYAEAKNAIDDKSFLLKVEARKSQIGDCK